jgi:hypothetical protein
MLTVVQIQALKPATRPFKAFDSDGLYLLVQHPGRCSGATLTFTFGLLYDQLADTLA